MVVYRAVMFASALWLVLALLCWGWAAWKTNGIWRAREQPAAATA